MFELAREINRVRGDDPAHAAALGALLRELGGLLGILQDDPRSTCAVVNRVSTGLGDAEIESLIEPPQCSEAEPGTGLRPMRSATS